MTVGSCRKEVVKEVVKSVQTTLHAVYPEQITASYPEYNIIYNYE